MVYKLKGCDYLYLVLDEELKSECHVNWVPTFAAVESEYSLPNLFTKKSQRKNQGFNTACIWKWISRHSNSEY